MEARATARFVRMAPRKVRFVMDTIRGKYAQEALDLLKFTPNHAAAEISKVLSSAIANAENNHSMNGDWLKVSKCYVDAGPTLKRVQPRAQGRAYRILKRTSHITVIVEEGEAPPTTRPREAEIKRRGKKPPLRAALPSPVAPLAEESGPVAAEETTPEETPVAAEETAPAAEATTTAEAAGEEKAE